MIILSDRDITKTVQEQLNDSYSRMASLTEAIGSLKRQLEIVENQQSIIIELYKGVQVLIKVFAGMEKAAVWVTKIAAAVGIVWVIWKFTIMQTISDITKGK